MNEIAYSFLQVREVFHLEFLRMLARKLKPDMYVLKGGGNLRLFFRSPRYSEDIGLDVINVDVMKLQDTVMGILRSPSLRSSLMTYGIRDIGAPDLSKAKQTETTQRFKTHLFTTGGEDLYTKIECSRRGAAEGVCVEHVDQQTLRRYRLTPFICPHYGGQAAFLQKINALAGRVSVQARDIFDLFLLGPLVAPRPEALRVDASLVKKAMRNAYSVEFALFRDTVLEFISEDERASYDNAGLWDDMRLTVVQILEKML